MSINYFRAYSRFVPSQFEPWIWYQNISSHCDVVDQSAKFRITSAYIRATERLRSCADVRQYYRIEILGCNAPSYREQPRRCWRCLIFLYITVISRLPEPLLLKWMNPIHSMQNTLDLPYSVEWNYLSIPRSQQLYRWNVGNGELISSHALLDMWLLIHAAIKSMLSKYAPGVIRVFIIL